VNLRVTKTGRDQSVVIHEELVVSLLRRCRRRGRARGHVMLFPHLTAVRLRPLFHHALQLLGIPRGLYVFHSLRHGGATFDFLHKKLSFVEVQQRGRWVSSKTCRIYLQRGRSALLSTVLSREVRQRVLTIGSLSSHSLFGVNGTAKSMRGSTVMQPL
jgi:integrase